MTDVPVFPSPVAAEVPAADVPLVWRACTPGGLSWRVLDGECLLHDAGAGRTHLLDAVSAAVLDRIVEQPTSESALRVWLAAELDVPDDAAVHGVLQQALQQLAAIDLVEAGRP